MKQKKLLLLTSTFLTLVPLASVMSCSLFSGGSIDGRSDLEFYNYEDYLEPESENGINQAYIFNTYGDLAEFENYLRAERSVGGIGSDYFNVNLAKNNLITKLDLSKVFDLSADRSNWEVELQEIYTPEIWKILTSFDATLNDFGTEEYKNSDGEMVLRIDVDKDGIADHLWEYMIPFFNQNKVIAFNKKAITNPELLGGTTTINNQVALQNWFANNTDLSYEQILKTLTDAGAQTITINDYMRDNMMIGAEVIDRQNDPVNFETSGEIPDYETGKNQIDNFEQMINRVGLTRKIWTTNGTDALENIVTQSDNRRTTDMALIYNGDAMAAYQGGYNDNSLDEEVRVIVPKNSTFISDGIVMSSIIANDYFEQSRFYQTVYNFLVVGAQTDPDYDGFTGKWNRVWANFDYNVYTPAYKNVYTYMENNFFANENERFILEATRNGATNWNPSGNPDKISTHTLAQPIAKNLETKLISYYNQIKN